MIWPTAQIEDNTKGLVVLAGRRIDFGVLGAVRFETFPAVSAVERASDQALADREKDEATLELYQAFAEHQRGRAARRLSSLFGRCACLPIDRDPPAARAWRRLPIFEQAFDKLARELRAQYLVTYKPMNDRYDGSFRRIEIKLATGRDGVKIRAKRGYVASVQAR